MHGQRVPREPYDPRIQHHLAVRHVLDVALADDVVGGAQQVQLPLPQGRRLGHGGHDTCIDTQHHAGGFETQEQVFQGRSGAAASIVSAAKLVDTAGSGCTTARLSIHGFRGRTQTIRPGSTPSLTSHTMASVAVLPEPTITYWLGASASDASAFDRDDRVIVRNAEGGGDVAGIVGAR